MTTKIIIHNSEKIICKYFDNGYCRFQEVCKFMHPKENCENQKCPKRHPKFCKYFRRKKCTFNEKCLFRHGNNSEESSTDRESPLKTKINELENDITVYKATIETLKKEIEMKDFIISAKENTINKKDEELKVSEKEICKRNSHVTNLKSKLKIK